MTAVGGTSLEVGAADDYLGEFGWSTSRSDLATAKNGSLSWSPTPPGYYVYGAGGGVSSLFAEPWYQVKAGIDSAPFGWPTTGRVVPDVAALADPNTGMLVGQTQSFPDGNY